MSEEMVGQSESFLKGHQVGLNEGYRKALIDVEVQLHCCDNDCGALSIIQLVKILEKLRDRI